MTTTDRYKINWTVPGYGRDEQVYFRGQIKTLIHAGMLEKVNEGPTLCVRNRIMRLLYPYEISWEEKKKVANRIMGIVYGKRT